MRKSDPSLMKVNTGYGWISCSEMHESVWKSELRYRRYHNLNQFHFIGNYQDSYRGRIFYNPNNGHFLIAVGFWIDELKNKSLLKLVETEFNLENSIVEIFRDKHWDLHQSWR